MSEGEPPDPAQRGRHSPRSSSPSRTGRRQRTSGWVALLVALLLVAGVGIVADIGGVRSRLGLAGPDPQDEPALIEPPAGLDLPPPAAPRPVAPALRGQDLDPAAVRRAVARLVRSKRLGRRVALLVTDLDGTPVYRRGDQVVTPASTTKLLTVAAALESLGGEHRFVTTVQRRGRTLVLVGGGDPLLEPAPDDEVSYPTERADLRTLARRVAAQVGDEARLRLRYDDSLFAGPSVNPRWRADYIPDDVVTPITALWSDEGRVPDGFGARVDDPARDAADIFADHLRRAGLRVGKPVAGRAVDEAQTVGGVRSAPLSAIAQYVVETSDNEAAEVLLRHVALSAGAPGSSAAGTRIAQQLLSEVGVGFPATTRWYDGSGLSRANRLSTNTLVDVLRVSLDRAPLSRVVDGLPVAGFSGSLTERFEVEADPGLGRVRAKTGTLTGVSGLAGVVPARDGAVMLFVVVADRVKESNTLEARVRLDQIAAALADCRCAASPRG